MENPSLIDDQLETSYQKYNRLHRIAVSASAEGRISFAEQVHLERIQLVSKAIELSSNSNLVHDSYFEYASFLLNNISNTDSADTSRLFSVEKAREVLFLASTSLPGQWKTLLVLASVLVELNQVEQAEAYFNEAIRLQILAPALNKSIRNISFAEFEGYDSDELCPIDPLSYSLLSVYFSMRERPLLARKMIRMAVR
jgi:tetratricopeptide (TPR) repeat protein